MKCDMSAVLFARNARRLTEFYLGALDGRMLRQDDAHAVLDWKGFHLVVHQIPAHLLDDGQESVPPRRREQSALRLDYPVADMARARASAARLGGQIDESPPPWADADSGFFLGFDPEGNVFGAKGRGR